MKKLLYFIIVSSCLLKAEGFFGFDEVRFFEKPQKVKTEEIKKETQIEENIWAEPVVGPDGKIKVYVPPKVVLDFLNNPNEENAKKYIEWNNERLTKIAKAQEILKRVSEKTLTEQTNQLNQLTQLMPKTQTETKKEIAVALSPECKYCKAEILILEAFKKKYPNLDIKLVWYGTGNSLPNTTLPVLLGKPEDKSKIKKFPTFFFVFPDGKTIGGEGFIDGKNLEEFCKKINFL